jgi:hypothetical protein
MATQRFSDPLWRRLPYAEATPARQYAASVRFSERKSRDGLAMRNVHKMS